MPDARVLASVYTGQSPAALRCSYGELDAADAEGLVDSLTTTLGDLDTTTTDAGEETPATLVVQAGDTDLAWAVAAHAVGNGGRHGVQSVETGGLTWSHDEDALADWLPGPAGAQDSVTITFAG